MNEVDSKKLRTHGLIFLMDYNEDMLGIEAKNPLKNVLEKDLGDMQDKEDSKDEAMIYIETLGIYNYATTNLESYSILLTEIVSPYYSHLAIAQSI